VSPSQGAAWRSLQELLGLWKYTSATVAVGHSQTRTLRHCNGKVSPSKALVKGLSIDKSFLNRLADEVRKDLG
jgi:hypothetical protein